jgi:hypothetical protein
MKILLIITFLIVSLISCKNNSSPVAIKPKVVVYDTIVIDNDKENEKREELNLSYKGLSKAEIIDVLKSLSEIQDIREFNEKELPFGNIENISKYYSNNIPSSIYKKIFSDEVIQINKIRHTNVKIDKKAKQVVIQKGPVITEERKYKTLLSLIEKEKYIQLVLTKQRKYSPAVELVTVSKKDFSQIDNISLFGGIYDSYDINYWHSELNNEYEEIKLTRVKNTEFNEVNLDTILIEYEISNTGEILKK